MFNNLVPVEVIVAYNFVMCHLHQLIFVLSVVHLVSDVIDHFSKFQTATMNTFTLFVILATFFAANGFRLATRPQSTASRVGLKMGFQDYGMSVAELVVSPTFTYNGELIVKSLKLAERVPENYVYGGIPDGE